jgi:1-acyl-sn-glycerol-3-phosphate acyltransferase
MPHPRLPYRFLRLGAHLLAGVLTALLLFPFLSPPERDKRVVRWAGCLLAIVGVRVTVRGRSPGVRGGGALVVANHVSWLDIYLLLSLLPARFVSKAEVRRWPVIGWLSEKAGTLFLERTRKTDALRMNRHMADHLRAGECLALFPEGTTTDGETLLPFYPSLFQPAVEAGAQVWPLLIRYRRADGSHCEAAAYYGEMSLLTSARRVMGEAGIHAELTFLPPIAAAGLHRRELASRAEAAIRAALADDGHDRAPERDVRLPAGRR